MVKCKFQHIFGNTSFNKVADVNLPVKNPGETILCSALMSNETRIILVSL